VQDAYLGGVVVERQNMRRKAKTRPTSIPSSIPADPILPRVEEKFEDLEMRMDSGENLDVRKATNSAKAAKKTKGAKSGGGGRDGSGNGNGNTSGGNRNGTANARGDGAAGGRGNGTANAGSKSKGPKSKAATTTGNANFASAEAVPIPTDAPTIAFPTDGASLPLIPTPKAGKTGSGKSTSNSTSSAVPTTLVKRMRNGGVEMAGWL